MDSEVQAKSMGFTKAYFRTQDFFKTLKNKRYHRNLIGAIKAEVRVLEEPNQIKEAAVTYFSNIFKEETNKINFGWCFPKNDNC